VTDIAGERAALAAQGLDIVTREEAGAVQSYTSERTVDPVASWLFLHLTVTADPADNPGAEAAAWRGVEAIGQQRFGIGFSYNAGAMQSGRGYEGQPLTRRGAHTVNDKNIPGYPTSLNYGGRAVALVQNVGDPVTDAQVDWIARWGAACKGAGLVARDAPWFGHRDFAFKSCPGDIGYARLPEIRQLTEQYVVLQEDDMPYTPEELTTIVRDAVQSEFTQVGDATRTAVFDLARRGALYGANFLAIADDFVQGGTVYYTDLKTKIGFAQGGVLHTQIKDDLAGQGLSTAARVLPAAVLAAIPDET